jgi:hypothetical protein
MLHDDMTGYCNDLWNMAHVSEYGFTYEPGRNVLRRWGPRIWHDENGLGISYVQNLVVYSVGSKTGYLQRKESLLGF